MEKKTIKASEGKIFRRKSDNQIFGDEISLGYTYYIGGRKLEVPHLEVEEDSEEIDAPIIIEENIDDIPVIEEEYVEEDLDEELEF